MDSKFEKCKKDNLYQHGITEDELKVRQIDGVFALDQLVQDRAAWMTGKLTMGSKYWAAFRTKWRDPNSAFAKLEPADAEQEIDDACYTALEAYLKGEVGKDHIPLDNWLDVCETLNQAEYCFLNRAMLLTPVQKSFANAERVVRSMMLARKAGCCETFPTETGVMKSHWDEALKRHLGLCQSQDVSMSEWWQDIWLGGQNLLPKVSMDAVVAVPKGGNFMAVANHVNIIHEGCGVGKILMEKIRRSLAAGDIATKFQAHINGCKELKHVDVASLERNRKAAMQELTSIGVDANGSFEKSRLVSCTYRRTTVKTITTSPMDMYYKMREAWLTGLAVDQGVLKPLWNEDDFLEKVAVDPAITLDPAVFAKAASTRSNLETSSVGEVASAVTVMALLKEKENFLGPRDRGFAVVKAFWTWASEASSPSHLGDTIKKCFYKSDALSAIEEVVEI